MSEEKVRVIVVPVGEPAFIEEGDPWEIAKRLAGDAYLEQVNIINGLLLYCDSDGISKRLKVNRAVPAYGQVLPPGLDFVVSLGKNLAAPNELGEHLVRGPFVISMYEFPEADEEDGRHLSLPSIEAENIILEYLNSPGARRCPRCGGLPAYHGAVYCGAACAAMSGA